ncbi:SCO6745 family protein [Actinocorallia populi]|uniref:SCO6745 family protein n=1 Tax=Actinocorallia populi TaxID=2079200 RepID=UPI001E60A1FB|nr:hypothetical protein [Actinocorallia populi]
MTRPATTAWSVKGHIQELGGAFMFSREARAFGEGTGVPGFIGPYMKGRCGVLGDVDADVVTSAVGFFHPQAVREAWESVEMPAAQAAEGYLHACHEFGRRKLASFDGSERLSELLLAVVRHGDATGAPLFAGWRAMPLADDARALVMQLVHTLREFRGGLHFLAVRAAGLAPVQAVLIGGSPMFGARDQALLYGWPESELAEVTDEQRDRWQEAELVTDRLAQQAFSVLDKAESEELAALMAKAHAAALSR